MNEEVLAKIAKQLQKDKAYFDKYNVKSPLLRMAQRFMELDNEDFKEECKK